MTAWRRSSVCADGSCVEVAWQSACASSNCVEVACSGGQVLVRDSKLGEESPVLRFSLGEWQEFVRRIKDADQELALRLVRKVLEHEGWDFNSGERRAFVAGVRRGEFDDPGAEWRSAVSTVADPGTETQTTPTPASVDDSTPCGPVPVNDHPAVLDKVRDVERLHLGPDDVLAFIVDHNVTHEEAAAIRAHLDRELPGVRKLIVAGAQLKVVTAALADTIDPKDTTHA